MRSELTRPFLFPVRPRHRETTESYTRRVLARNFETEQHQNYLIRLATTSLRKLDKAAAWMQILITKTKRETLYLDRHPTGWLSHPDGSSCELCASELPPRWMCTLCAHGQRVQQHPHFDDIVCIRHQRWVGLTTSPDSQHVTDREHVSAALAFDKMRRRRVLDVRLYTLIRDAIAQELTESNALPPIRPSEETIFPAVIKVASALTSADFARVFFNPARTFAMAYESLDNLVADAAGAPMPKLSRTLWLYMRPTFRALRHGVIVNEPYRPSWPHDFAVPPATANSFAARADDLEPFDGFLKATDDTELSATLSGIDYVRVVPKKADAIPGARRRRLAICGIGHEFETDAPTSLSKTPTAAPPCTVCNRSFLAPGYNDLGTLNAPIGAELDPVLNCGLTARDVSPSSHLDLFWRCPKKRHCYSATPSNRTSARMGCGICSNRTLVPGINDLGTTHPRIAGEIHPDLLLSYPPTSLLASSEIKLRWLCANNHDFPMRVYERTQGGTCPECTRIANRASSLNITVTHPVVANEWHPTDNGDKRPDDFTHGSGEVAFWLCPVGHKYPMRIERRTSGCTCSVCSRRRLVPHVNDLATQEPIMVLEFHSYRNGPKEPHEIFPGTNPFWWKCRATGHELQQSVPNRRKSKGCTECPPPKRILATAV